MMEHAPIKKTRNCGGKIARKFKEMEIDKMGELQQFTEAQLGEILEDTEKGKWLYARCRGICDEELREHIKNPSMLAVKSFKELQELSEVRER